jgi:hypothetical protein
MTVRYGKHARLTDWVTAYPVSALRYGTPILLRITDRTAYGMNLTNRRFARGVGHCCQIGKSEADISYTHDFDSYCNFSAEDELYILISMISLVYESLALV